MYWYKVKNLLIILFALINIFLIGVIVFNKAVKKAEDKALTESLINVLMKNEISVDKNSIPENTPMMSAVTIENMAETLFEDPEKIFGAAPSEGEDEIGRYLFHGSKKARVVDGRFYYTDSGVTALDTLTEQNANKALGILSKMGFDTKNLRPALYGDRIIFSYYVKNFPIFVYNITVTMSQNEIATVSGYPLKITGSAPSKTEIRSAGEILMDFLKDPSRPAAPMEIKKINVGYSVLLDGGVVNFKSADAVPTYRIITGDNKSYFYDGRSLK